MLTVKSITFTEQDLKTFRKIDFYWRIVGMCLFLSTVRCLFLMWNNRLYFLDVSFWWYIAITFVFIKNEKRRHMKIVLLEKFIEMANLEKERIDDQNNKLGP